MCCCCRLTGSADLFNAVAETGLPGGLAAGRRPTYGLNGASYFGKVSSLTNAPSEAKFDMFIDKASVQVPLSGEHVAWCLCVCGEFLWLAAWLLHRAPV